MTSTITQCPITLPGQVLPQDRSEFNAMLDLMPAGTRITQQHGWQIGDAERPGLTWMKDEGGRWDREGVRWMPRDFGINGSLYITAMPVVTRAEAQSHPAGTRYWMARGMEDDNIWVKSSDGDFIGLSRIAEGRGPRNYLIFENSAFGDIYLLPGVTGGAPGVGDRLTTENEAALPDGSVASATGTVNDLNSRWTKFDGRWYVVRDVSLSNGTEAQDRAGRTATIIRSEELINAQFLIQRVGFNSTSQERTWTVGDYTTAEDIVALPVGSKVTSGATSEEAIANRCIGYVKREDDWYRTVSHDDIGRTGGVALGLGSLDGSGTWRIVRVGWPEGSVANTITQTDVDRAVREALAADQSRRSQEESRMRAQLEDLNERLHQLARDHAVEDEMTSVLEDFTDVGVTPLTRDFTVDIPMSGFIRMTVTARDEEAAIEMAVDRHGIYDGYDCSVNDERVIIDNVDNGSATAEAD